MEPDISLEVEVAATGSPPQQRKPLVSYCRARPLHCLPWRLSQRRVGVRGLSQGCGRAAPSRQGRTGTSGAGLCGAIRELPASVPEHRGWGRVVMVPLPGWCDSGDGAAAREMFQLVEMMRRRRFLFVTTECSLAL